MNNNYSATDFKLSEKYVAVVLGMDILYRSTTQSYGEKTFEKEGLVPINLTEIEPYPIESWEEAVDKLREIYEAYTSEHNDIRRNYMLQQIYSTITLAKWISGENIPYRELVRQLLYVNENPLTYEQQKKLHEKLDTLLQQRGYKGNLEEKIKQWENERYIPPEKLISTLTSLLNEARTKTIQMGFEEISDVQVNPKIVYDVPFQAYCDFLGNNMYLNGDISYTYESLKHLVTHEAFPGHTTHLTIRQHQIRSGKIPADAGLVITNTASSPTFEGIGDNGLQFLNWENTIDDHINDILQTIRSTSSLIASHMIHTERRNINDVKKFMKTFSFKKEDKWIQSRLRFITHPFRAPFIYSYWRGKEKVRRVYRQIPEKNKQHFFRYLYGHMHSLDTVEQYLCQI
jgi:hypothetical protein